MKWVVWFGSIVLGVPCGKSRKFHWPWQGPYLISKAISDVGYQIKEVRSPHWITVVHFDRLKPYHKWQQVEKTIPHAVIPTTNP